MRKFASTFVMLCTGALLAACGGGSQVEVLEGAYDGTAIAKAGAYGETAIVEFAFNSLTLEDGDSWILYGAQDGDTMTVLGMVYASPGSSDGSVYQAQHKDYYADGTVHHGHINGTYGAGQSFKGTLVGSDMTTTFTSEATSASKFDYRAAADLSRVSGNWSGKDMAGGAGQVSIDAGGAIQGSIEGCGVTGQVEPHPSGKNVFNARLKFGPEPSCKLPGEQATGVAVTYTLTGGRTQLIIMGTTAGAAAGTTFIASR